MVREDLNVSSVLCFNCIGCVPMVSFGTWRFVDVDVVQFHILNATFCV